MSLTTSIIANYEIGSIIEIDGDFNLDQVSRVVEVDASSNDVIITLGAITNNTLKYLPMIIKRIDESTVNTVRINGTNGNFEEDDNFTPLSQTVSKTDDNELTASADVSAELRAGDTIQVAGSDIFTVTNIASTVITTLETVATAYSNATLGIGGYFLGEDTLLEAIEVYANKNNVWRSV